MRLHEVYLLEYNRNVTQDKWSKRILAAAEINFKTIDDFWLQRRFEDIAAPGVEPFSKPDWVDPEYRIDPDGYEDNVWKDVFVDDVLEALEEMDPTPNKQYVPILLKWYCGSIAKNQQLQVDWQDTLNAMEYSPDDGYPQDWSDLESSNSVDDFEGDFENFRADAQNLNTFQIEDGEQIADTLQWFHQYKQQLPLNNRDIGRYPSYYNFEDTIDSFRDTNKVDDSTPETTLARDDVTVLYNGPMGTVTIPKTHEASCELGRGTKWCTATTNNDEWFKNYNKLNDLIIYNEKPGNAKYQFHVTLQGIEARDARDRSISNQQLSNFSLKHPVISPILKKAQKTALLKIANLHWNNAPGGVLGPTIYTANLILDNMIAGNEARGGGVMRFVDGYYTSPNSTSSLANEKHIPKSSYTKRMVKYALQRNKPWPEMEKLIIKLLQLKMPNIDYTKSAHLQTVNKFFTAMDKYVYVLNPQWKEYNNIKSEMTDGFLGERK
jgi:hypothetical protein